MKTLLWASGLFALLLGSACGNTNTSNSGAADSGDLKTQIQQQVAVGEAAAQLVEETNENFNTLASQLSQAPAALKADSTYQRINMLLAGYQRKNDSRREQHEDMAAHLKKLAADYEAGAIKEEEARKEYQLLQQNYRYAMHDDSMIMQAYGNLSADYGKMMATFKAKAEEN